jgi:GNAT superfamily N-acetyltransferase
MVRLVPHSNGEDASPLHEFNPCHSPDDGKFCSGPKFSAGKMPTQASEFVGKGIIEVFAGARTIARLVFLDGHTPGKLTRVTTSQVASEFQRKGWGVWLYKRAAQAAIEAGATGIWSSGHGRNHLSDRVWAALERKGLAEKLESKGGRDIYRMPPAGGVKKLREFNPCHSPEDGQFCSSISKGGWVETSAHPVSRVDSGAWGSSHGLSRAMAALAAERMGIPGYRKNSVTPYPEPVEEFLRRIAGDKVGAEEPLYHGFQNVGGLKFKPGSTFRLPLTATAGDIEDVVGYGKRSDIEDQEGEPTVIAFPKGTPIVAYSKWNKTDAQEFGHVYSEAITAGEFRVTKVRTMMARSGQHDRKMGKHYPHTRVRVVDVEPVGVFNPDTGKWTPRKFREMNTCHSPEDGKFCSGPKGYKIVFGGDVGRDSGILSRHLNHRTAQLLTSTEQRKAKSAKVFLIFDGIVTAHLGAPVKWTAPNGVTVVYDREQRRSPDGGKGSSGVYHDFDPGWEKVVPLTRNVGPARRALRAWAAAHMTSGVTARMQARQMVRPGD